MSIDDQPVFYYDLGSTGCYLAAERIMGQLPVVPEWEPVLGARLGFAEPRPDPVALAATVAAHGLQPLRLPARWPARTEQAMLTATYAKHVGRAVAFSLAAFRQAFAAGRDLDDEGTVLIAAAACEMHPTAVLKGSALRSTAIALDRAGRRAITAGARCLPAIQIGDRMFDGEDALQRATAALGVAAPLEVDPEAMRANRAFRLIVSREGREPAFLADPKRTDRIEVVSVDDGELMLYWDLPAKQAAKLAKQLRADLAGLEAEEFIALWEGADGPTP